MMTLAKSKIERDAEVKKCESAMKIMRSNEFFPYLHRFLSRNVALTEGDISELNRHYKEGEFKIVSDFLGKLQKQLDNAQTDCNNFMEEDFQELVASCDGNVEKCKVTDTEEYIRYFTIFAGTFLISSSSMSVINISELTRGNKIMGAVIISVVVCAVVYFSIRARVSQDLTKKSEELSKEITELDYKTHTINNDLKKLISEVNGMITSLPGDNQDVLNSSQVQRFHEQLEALNRRITSLIQPLAP